MPGNFFAGKNGSATINGTIRYCKKWVLEDDAGEHDTTNMDSEVAGDGSSWREFIGGFVSGTLSMDCVLDPTLSRPVRGAQVTYTAVVGGGYGFSGNAIFKGSSSAQDVEGVAMITYRLRLTGPPTVV